MNNTESNIGFADVLGYIDDGLVLDSLAPVKKISPLPRILAAAACFMLLIGAAFAAPRLIGRTPFGDKAASLAEGESSAPSAAESPAATAGSTAAPRIVYASDSSSPQWAVDDYITSDGEVRLAGSLIAALDDSEYDGCLFAVRIFFNSWYGDGIYNDVLRALREEEHAAIHDPLLEKYNSETSWYKQQFIWDQTPEEHMMFDYGQPDCGVDFNEYFTEKADKKWRGEHTAEECAALDAAIERKDKAIKAEEAFVRGSYLNDPVANERVEKELKRLADAGIAAEREIDSFALNAFLSKDQLKNFPASSYYGYEIHWVGHTDAWDE